MIRAFRFSVPASAGVDLQSRRRLETYLEARLRKACSVSVIDGYDALAVALLAGSVDAAWAPPMICARLEQADAPVALRCIRGGASSYRAAIVVRADSTVTLENVGRQRAAWTDADSIAGYRLPAAWLNERRPRVAADQDFFVGSYRAALEAVLDGQAGVTSVFAPSGLQEVWPERASSFRVLALTNEAPNDGVATSRALSTSSRQTLTTALLALNDSAYGEALLNECFHADRLEAAPSKGYRALY